MANDLEQKIIKQLEYYFGDINLPRDKFMNEQIKLDEGWIPLDVLLSFKRLATLSSDPEVIADAAAKSTNDLLEVSEDKKKIRRNPSNPMPEMNEERRKELVTRTAYAKGFGLEDGLDTLMEFLKEHGPVESCYRRTYNDKATKTHKFKGSCFIVFKDIDTCKKFIDAEEILYNEKNLLRKWQADYIEEKKKERDEIKTKSGKKNDNNKEKELKNGKKKIEFPKGAVVYFEGVPEGSSLSREEIKEKIIEVGEIEPSYIDYSKGQTIGHIRYPEENNAIEVMKKFEDNKLKIGEITLEMRALEGEEEEKFLDETSASIARRKQQHKARGNFGGGGRRNKRKGNRHDDGPPAKK